MFNYDKKKERREEGQMLVESALYLTLALIVVACIAVLSISKLDISMFQFQHAETVNRYAAYIESDGLKAIGGDIHTDLSIGVTEKITDAQVADYYAKMASTTNLFINRRTGKGLVIGPMYFTRYFGNQRYMGISTFDIQQAGVYRLKADQSNYMAVPSIFQLLGIGGISKNSGAVYAVSADEAEMLRIGTWSAHAYHFGTYCNKTKTEQQSWVRRIVNR